MKSSICFVRRGMAFIMVVATAMVWLSSCVKGGTSSNVVSNAALLVVNLAPDQSSVSLALSGNAITPAPLSYASYSGSYLGVTPGSYTVSAMNGVNQLATTNYLFTSNNYYSVFVVGNNGAYRAVIAPDTFRTFVTGLNNTYVRYINAIADTVNNAHVTITDGSATEVNETAPFSNVNGFRVMPAGTVLTHVTSAAGVDTTNSFVAAQDYAYTILLVGVPGATDAAKKVQVRFLAHGSLVQ